MVAESLHCDLEHARPIAELVHDKTRGNPFFAIQFLSTLFEDGLLGFDHARRQWHWDFDRIRASAYTDNVVDLMVHKLNRLDRETQDVLMQLACLGNSADVATIRIIYQDTAAQLAVLAKAAGAGFILRSKDSYRFLHDRVQEAAYSLIPKAARAETHLRIGRLMAANTPPHKLDDEIFEIVNQLNHGRDLVASTSEREQIARLNLVAARRAKTSTAYDSALNYLHAARNLLADDIWSRNYALVFSIEYLLAECELLSADMVAAENRLSMLADRAQSPHDVAVVTRLRLTLYTALDCFDRAVGVVLEFLRSRGTDWSPQPTEQDVSQEYDKIWSLLGARQIEELIDLPVMTDRDVLDIVNVLTEIVTPALFVDAGLLALVICRMINLSLEHGNSDGSCFAYACFSMVAGPRFGNHEAGFRFGKLGHDLVEQRGLRRYRARTNKCFAGLTIPWTRHLNAVAEFERRCFEAATKIGDLTYAAYSCNGLQTTLLAAGAPLDEVQREAEKGFEFATGIRFGLVIDCITAQLGLIRSLRGLTSKFGEFNDDNFDEFGLEHHFASDPALALPECWYWIRKLQARFFAGDYQSAIEASLKAERLLWTSPSFFEVAEYHFYSALSRTAAFDAASGEIRQSHVEALATHQKQHEIWARNCPENFENRAAMINAEIARIEGRVVEAEHLYERAIRSSQNNGFVHNEALANELAAQFYRARGFETIANAYLRNARSCYVRWGAGGKVRQLDAIYPRPGTDEPALTSTIAASVEHLDLATVIKLSQALSSEGVPEKLLETLMCMTIEQAGAERALLILSNEAGQRIAAEATTKGDVIRVTLRDDAVTADALPEAVFHYVLRTRETLALGDATRSAFSADLYISRRKARSILCLPLLNQASVVGALFLENNLAPHVFAPARIAVLKLLASQAAMSLENSRLYRDVAGREAKIRRLVDSNIIGIVIWDLDGRILDANDAFLRIIGYNRDDLQAGLGWFEITPPEWQDAHVLYEAEELKMTGMMQAREKEYFRKDGSRVPVLIGAACFENQPNQGVAYILDLTERKRMEAAARESERRYRDVQMELAHASRVATMGQLTGSIAHEVSQPIAATVASAQAAARWLDRHPPDVEKARRSLARIIRDGERAGAVLQRTRALIKKDTPRWEHLEINAPIAEVIELTHGEATKSRVSVKASFAKGLPGIRGDRVQIQQVMLNLVINAIEAMEAVDDGIRELTISTERAESGEVLVAVRDTGPGLTQADRERVFDAFYTTKSAGLGMGLSICQSIIEAHSGHLWASANEPHGAVFQFTLPPCDERPLAPDKEQARDV